MKIAILGADGQLGSTLAARARRGHDVAAFGRSLDLTDGRALAASLRGARPDAIVNAAAFAEVDDAEDHPVTALAVNAWAVRDLARLARELDATLVHFSSDFVFDGAASAPYVETDAPRPRGVYAMSKLAGDWFAADAPRHLVLRVESLFGGAPAKSSIDQMRVRIRAGDAVRAFADRVVSPSFVEDVADAVMRALERPVPSGTYHCVNSGHATWLEVARYLARAMGRPDAPIEPVNMAVLDMRVPRPLFAALSNAKLAAAGVAMPSWRDAIDRYAASGG